jgi:acetyl-CoA acetyltransferase
VLLHPSQVICPTCLGSDLVWTAVDGRAVVVGCTVNELVRLPGYLPPYSIAIVELAAAPGVRLTTNVVNCPPADVHVGMQVTVVFQQQDDVWFPLFEPNTGAPVTVPEPQAPRPRPRPMVSTTKFEDRVALTGVGMSQVGRRLMRTPLSLTVEAARAAVEDAGLTMADIDGLSTYPGGMVAGMGISEGGIPAVEEALRINPVWHNGTMETSGQTGSVVEAMLAVASGLCRHVLCFRTVWEATNTELMRTGKIAPAGMGMGGRVSGDMQWRIPFGAISAGNWIAMYASQYFKQYGAGRETLGEIALNARTNAARNPNAIYTDPITMDDYLSARMISTPFGLYDCDVPCDGAVAIIVSAVETAGDLRQQPVLVEAVGTKIDERQSWDQGTITHLPNVFGPAAHLWSRTTLSPKDVDVAELYDGFTFNALSWLEALGFCGVGEGPAFVEGGKRIALDGELPLNTHGGQLSGGRTHGYGFLHEAVVQLRGSAGDRQVPNAQVAAVSAGGGVPAGAFLLRRG